MPLFPSPIDISLLLRYDKYVRQRIFRCLFFFDPFKKAGAPFGKRLLLYSVVVIPALILGIVGSGGGGVGVEVIPAGELQGRGGHVAVRLGLELHRF